MPLAKHRAPMKASRGKFENGGLAFTGQASITDDLKKRILEIDDKLELHDIGKGVHMYRILSYGAAKSDDVLFHQFQLKWPPGEWIIRCLHECDTWRKHGSGKRAAKAILREIENEEEAYERERNLRTSELSTQLAKDLLTYGVRGKKSVYFGG